MQLLTRYVNRYRLFWLVVIALFGTGVYFLLFLRPRDPAEQRVSPEEVQSGLAETKGNPPEQKTGERSGPIKLEVSGVMLTLASSDGALEMRVWADEGEKNGAVYSIKEGALLFVLENRDTLLLKVTDAQLQSDDQQAWVDGSITGKLVESGQGFSAKHLTWKLNEKTITVADVTYIGPSIEVHGKKMHVDLEHATVDFEDSVEAGI